VCEVCGKGITRGKKGIHKHSIQWKKRAPLKVASWKPNLRRVKISLNGQTRKMRICAECLKSTKIITTEPLNLQAKNPDNL